MSGFLHNQFSRRSAWSVAFVLCGILAPFACLNLVRSASIFLTDESYQYLCCRSWQDCPLGLLTFFIGNLWMNIFGHTLITLRVLYALCIIVAAAIGSFYFYRNNRNLLLSAVLFFITSIGGALCYLPLYGWDVGAYPWLAATLCLTLSYWRRTLRWKAAVLGFLVACTTLARLPLGILFPIIFVLILIGHKRNKLTTRSGCINALIFGVVYAILLMVLATVLVGSPGTFIVKLQNAAISGHTGTGYINSVISRMSFFIPLVAIGILPLSLAFLYSTTTTLLSPKKRPNRILTFLLSALLAFVAFYTSIPLLHQAYFYGLAFPIIFVGLLYPWLYRIYTGHRISCLSGALWIIALFMLAATVGSDSPLGRFTQCIWAIPFIFAVLWPALGPTARICFRTYFPICILVISFTWLFAYAHSYVKSPTISQDSPYLNGLRMDDNTAYKFGEISGVIRDNNLPLDSLEIVGPEHYGFNAAFATTTPVSLQHFHWNPTTDQDKEILNCVARKRAAIIMIESDAGGPEVTYEKAKKPFYKLYMHKQGEALKIWQN